ncbi:MAG: PBP1A family penicillin-binding protein [Alphaproteobacteria bacterium]|nr:PBP1A family penicillin-binding protein [Alphaproteobacteria bacterium]
MATKRATARGGARTAAKPSPAPRRWLWPRLGHIAKWLAVAAIWGGVALGLVVAYFAWDLPTTGDLATDQAKTRRPGIVLLDRSGGRLATFGDLYGERLTAAELPPHLAQAIVAIEDRRFFKHPGLDWRGILRAAIANLRAGRVAQGGSTLTQQLAKNLFLTAERSYERKIKELLLAFWLEARFSKDELLTIYLNRVYFGAGNWGVEAAARAYFDTTARRLDLYQSALLAGLLRAPSRWNPATNPAASHSRTLVVLQAMVEAGFIGADDAAAAARRHAGRPAATGAVAGIGRHFADWALERAAAYAGQGDLTVETTLDPRLQRAAEGIVARTKLDGAEVALVAMTPDGAVRAMVGGSDWRASRFNRATQALRQPGSAFKPIVWLAALEAGLGPDSPVLDAPITIDGWSPGNFDGRYRGTVDLRTALAHSLNSASVRLALKVGPARIVGTARRLGIASALEPTAGLALGVSEVTLVELVGAYAAIANGGTGIVPRAIAEVRGRSGDVLWRAGSRSAGPGRVLDAGTAAAMTSMLREVVLSGTGRVAAAIPGAAGKTGTSQDYRDAWFIGFVPGLVAGVWIGRDDNAPLDGVSGGGLPARLWRDFMNAAN